MSRQASPRPAPLLAFNEPESSLHPDLLPGLADLFAEAATRTQVWVTTHAPALARAPGLGRPRGRASRSSLPEEGDRALM